MRPILCAALAMFLVSCADHRRPTLSTAPPSLGVARAALGANAPEIALHISSDALTRSPDDAEALLIRGDALAMLDQTADATTTYRRVLALDPASTAARLGLGRLTLEADPAGAEALFLAVLARDARNAQALNDLGIAQDLQGRHTEAQESYRRALGVAPDMQAATDNLVKSMALSRPAR